MKTEITRVEPSTMEAAVAAAAERLLRGEIVGLPTETVYGLAARTEREAELRALKGRDSGKPITWAVASRDDAARLADLSHPGLAKLARRFWPGPLTLVAAREGGGKLGLRVPGHPLALAVLRAVAQPLLLTSANRGGEPPARTAAEVVAAFDGALPLLLDAGKATLGEASAVVEFDGPRVLVHREGVIDREMIRRTAATNVLLVCSGNTCRSPMAEVRLRKLLADKRGVASEALLEHGFLVHSAGVSAVPGIRATPEAEETVARAGLDLRSHRARALTPEMARAADVIYAMTAAHKRDVAAIAPEAAAKTKLLDPEGRDIRDPIGGTFETYRDCMLELDRALQRRVAELT